MTKISEQFIGQYSLSKTLRFELRPIGATQKLMEDFKGQAQDSLFEFDAERARAYPQVKKVLDDYYRSFIEDVLSWFQFKTTDIRKAFELYRRAKTDKAAGQEYAALAKTLRGFIAKAFTAKNKDYMLDEYKKLFKQDSNSKLYEWLDNRVASGAITTAEHEDIINALKKFDSFTTYFVGYKQVRENLFVADDKATAIANRVVNENLPRFFENCLRMERIKSAYPELYQAIAPFASAFVPETYANVLSQSVITQYNQMIGRPGQDPDVKGVNSLINEYRQKNRIHNRDLPMMAPLYKQLLSDREEMIQDIIGSEEEMTAATREALELTQTTAAEIGKLAVNYIVADNAESIFINGNALSNLSHKLYSEWDLINRAAENRLESLRGTEKKRLENALKTAVSMAELQAIIDEHITGLDDALRESYAQVPALSEYFRQQPATELKAAVAGFERTAQAAKERQELINATKEALDKALEVVHFYRPLYLFKGRSPLEVAGRDENFYNEFERLFNELNRVSRIYDKVRNFATKKQFSQEKIKLNFNAPTLLGGWDLNKEQDNLSLILLRDGLYYLLIMNRDHRGVFNLGNEEVKQKALAQPRDASYRKLEYKQISGASKMLPKVFFAGSNAEIFTPSSEILAIRENGSHKKEAGNAEALHKWIDFCQQSIIRHPEWNEHYEFKFKPAAEYRELTEFYNDFDRQAYKIKFVDIKAGYIDGLVADGKAYLFQIYNKDFSPHSKGKPNLHTTYWRMLFDEENLRNIADNKETPVFKLNGEAEIFFRQASLEPKITHPKGQPLENKNKSPNAGKTESTFDYDLIKDKRYTQDKLFFHCPITINFRAPGVTAGTFNRQVNQFVDSNPEVNIIGIDRGERHLLYYTVINQRGEILEQGSLNQIHNSYTSAGQTVERDINYRELLHGREKERDEARRNWGTIENIKELKAGYLSQVVHKLSQLMIEHNAVVVLEDLNAGFKRSRIKVEKQVYQKFEKALIDKLNYLVFKDAASGSPGHYLRGYQLTAPFGSFKDLGRQSGFLYYVYPSYTSHICPRTGFVNQLKPRYESVDKAITFLSKFDKIIYQPTDDHFEFTFDYGNFGKPMAQSEWTVCTAGERRYYYVPKTKENIECNVTGETKELFDQAGIDYKEGNDLLPAIIQQREVPFFKGLLRLLGLTLQMRYTTGGTGDTDDFILSPVRDENGDFFDSRKAADIEPQNADANGAYHIALKGLKMISSIEDGKIKTVSKNEMQEWFAYVQRHEYR